MAKDREEQPEGGTNLTHRLADRWGVDPAAMYKLLDSVFPGVQRQNMFGALTLAHEHGLNPFIGEINILDTKKGMKPYVTIDGFIRIVQDHPQYDGSETKFDVHEDERLPHSCTVTIYRKDRKHPEVHTEFFSECRKNTPPWNDKPFRMMKHRAFMQCARYAFGLGGLKDQEEVAEIIEAEYEVSGAPDANASIKEKLGLHGSSVRVPRDDDARDDSRETPPPFTEEDHALPLG